MNSLKRIFITYSTQIILLPYQKETLSLSEKTVHAWLRDLYKKYIQKLVAFLSHKQLGLQVLFFFFFFFVSSSFKILLRSSKNQMND